MQFNNPCSCIPINNRGIGINCSGSQTFEQILYSLQPLMEKPNIRIELLRIEHIPIPQFQLDTLASLTVRHLILYNNTMSQFQVLTSNDNLISSLLFNTVEQLEIQNNEITKIEDCPALALFSNLYSLSLSGNKLTQISAKTFFSFNSRKKLKQLDLSENLFSDISINSEAFFGLEFLQKLSLEKNRLNYFPTEAIALLSDSLEELFLSANQIINLEFGSIPYLPRLKTLGLDVNKLNNLDSNTFNSIPSLWYLYLSQNQFTSIPSIFNFIPELKVLSIGGNPIERIESNTFLLAKSLLRLDLSQCKINYLNENCFVPISRIQFINLRGNKLKYISNKLFQKENQISFIVSIDLAQNQIEKINDFAFSNLNQLHSIDLSYNQIQILNPNTFRETFLEKQNSENVQILDLTENPINCNNDKIEWLFTLKGNVKIQGRKVLIS
ncbi:hypothetical protein Mgra_00003363 [Meloidogyne graminicola]|uniref:Uncharacterized protein n=1 Tax=Meloidogyne graminicola TaxID=189291 RepID=A0A8S9ZVA5_9BILA|nr:hypothetical protein Mgra_00003363 [Meloidogyne graminicola]